MVSKMVFQRGIHTGIHSHMVGSFDRIGRHLERNCLLSKSYFLTVLLLAILILLLLNKMISLICKSMPKHCEVFLFFFYWKKPHLKRSDSFACTFLVVELRVLFKYSRLLEDARIPLVRINPFHSADELWAEWNTVGDSRTGREENTAHAAVFFYETVTWCILLPDQEKSWSTKQNRDATEFVT